MNGLKKFVRYPTIPMITHKLNGPIKLFIGSDFHLGSPECNVKAIKDYIEFIASDANNYIVLGGDLIDSATKSSKGSTYEATMNPDEQIDFAISILEPIKNRILCATGGNHEARITRDTSLKPDKIIAQALGAGHLYRHEGVYLKIDLGNGSGAYRGKRRPKYSIAVTHGASGGLMAGAGLNKNEPYAKVLGVDLLMSGHTHKPASTTAIRFEADMGAGVLVPKESKILIGTGWLGFGGYGEEKMYSPLPIVTSYAELSADEHQITIVTC